jgi:uncharacterized membrane protein
MNNQNNDPKSEKRVIINWLAHHNPNRRDFNEHVIYIFNYAVCIGCFSFYLGITVALILGNLFYYYIVNFISVPLVVIIFFLCWIPSIIQYSMQYLTMKPVRNRKVKFITRFFYPIGSILFIFKSPLLGFLVSIPAGFLIIFIRKRYLKKKRRLRHKLKNENHTKSLINNYRNK